MLGMACRAMLVAFLFTIMGSIVEAARVHGHKNGSQGGKHSHTTHPHQLLIQRWGELGAYLLYMSD
jgi:hypothetical protein